MTNTIILTYDAAKTIDAALRDGATDNQRTCARATLALALQAMIDRSWRLGNGTEDFDLEMDKSGYTP